MILSSFVGAGISLNTLEHSKIVDYIEKDLNTHLNHIRYTKQTFFPTLKKVIKKKSEVFFVQAILHHVR